MSSYCLYLRKSRKDIDAEKAGAGESLAIHRKALLDVAQRQGLKVTAEYKEIVSGESIAARPQMQKLLEAVEAGEYAGVLVMEVERLARGDTIDQGVVARTFKRGNCKIVTPLKTYDPNNEYDEEYFEFGLFMSRREYKAIRRRIERGRIAAAEGGKFIGSTAPFGYRKHKIPDGKGYTLEIDKSEASAVKLIFDMYVNGGLGMPAICRRLDELGIPTRTGNPWSRYTVKDILTNPTYIGKIRWGHKKEVLFYDDEGNIRRKRDKSGDDCICVSGLHDAIIDEDIFNKVPEIMTRNKRNSAPTKNELCNPLSGLIYCKKCGHMMTRLGSTAKTPYDTLKCPNRYCNNVSAPLYLVEDKILSVLKEWVKAGGFKPDDTTSSMHSELVMLEKAINDGKISIDKLENQRLRAYDLIEQGVYTKDVFEQRMSHIQAQIEEKTLSIAAAGEKIDKLHEASEYNENFIPFVADVLKLYPLMDSAEEKNHLLSGVIGRVEYLKAAPNKKGLRDAATFEIAVFPRVLYNH